MIRSGLQAPRSMVQARKLIRDSRTHLRVLASKQQTRQPKHFRPLLLRLLFGFYFCILQCTRSPGFGPVTLIADPSEAHTVNARAHYPPAFWPS
jgi:hypothetical protein